MAEPIDVYVDLHGETLRVGTLYREAARNREAVSFEYHAEWLENDKRFALEPALQVGRGRFYPDQGREMFSAIGDSAPDTWGRQLMRRAERRRADAEDRVPRTLQESDFLLGVSDVSRLGALRFKREDDNTFQAPTDEGVPGFVRLGRLLESAERIERSEESDEDLQMIIAPGSSLGGARPKASVMDNDGQLSIAKFPKDTDEYSIETWEHIALTLAKASGVFCSEHQLVHVSDKPVLLSKRFDREGVIRFPFLSAMSLLQLKDGDRSSYPEVLDALTHVGAKLKSDAPELFRRMVLNVLISNVDDHLRNHGFLMKGKEGWQLSPVYDLNPTPQDVHARILSTFISPTDASCSIPLALEQAPYFNLKKGEAKQIINEVALAVSAWRSVAAQTGQTKSQIERMASAFEHEDLELSLAMDN